MRPMTKHFWGTPKCGTNLIRNVWGGIEKNVDYTFLLARNPYNRLASLYAEKIIILNIAQLSHPAYQVDPTNYQARAAIASRQASDFISLNKDIRDLTFKDFCYCLNENKINSGDLHMRKQTDFVSKTFDQSWTEIGGLPPKEYFEDILFMEDLPNCFEIPAKKLGVDIQLDKLRSKGGENATPRNSDLDTLKEAWNIKASRWWDYDAMPSSYMVLYSDELKDLVYNLYKDDFEYFNIKK